MQTEAGHSCPTKRPPIKVVEKSRTSHRRRNVSVDLDLWPFCIVWVPLPVLTWFLPTIGHTGIANSKGVIYDFSDDYQVTVDNFSYGSPTKFYQFQPTRMPLGEQSWDQAITEISDYYSKTRHTFCFNNCHQYIASVLNKVNYDGRKDWTQTHVWRFITYESQYVNWIGFVRQWVPFITIMLFTFILVVVIIT